MKNEMTLPDYYYVGRTHLIDAQCRSIPINADQNFVIVPKYFSNRINVDQFSLNPPNTDQCHVDCQ